MIISKHQARNRKKHRTDCALDEERFVTAARLVVEDGHQLCHDPGEEAGLARKTLSLGLLVAQNPPLLLNGLGGILELQRATLLTHGVPEGHVHQLRREKTDETPVLWEEKKAP